VINNADKHDLIDPEALRTRLAEMRPLPGLPLLRQILDRRSFTLTDSELERLFLQIIRKAGLPSPLTQQRVNGFKVDFLWPELGLVVETDGLRYHRTPAQQARDLLRDQAHTATGLTPLRFTRARVRAISLLERVRELRLRSSGLSGEAATASAGTSLLLHPASLVVHAALLLRPAHRPPGRVALHSPHPVHRSHRRR
jgi:very-short-patch-repair endonuclease